MRYYLFLVVAAFLTLSACDQTRSPAEKVIDNTNDVLDRRPNERMRDAAEDAADGVDDTGKNFKETLRDVTN